GHVTGVQTCALPISRVEALAVVAYVLEYPDDRLEATPGLGVLPLAVAQVLLREVDNGVSVAFPEEDAFLVDLGVRQRKPGVLPEIGRAACRERVEGG